MSDKVGCDFLGKDHLEYFIEIHGGGGGVVDGGVAGSERKGGSKANLTVLPHLDRTG